MKKEYRIDEKCSNVLTLIGLLECIEDGKQPKSIKFRDRLYMWHEFSSLNILGGYFRYEERTYARVLIPLEQDIADRYSLTQLAALSDINYFEVVENEEERV